MPRVPILEAPIALMTPMLEEAEHLSARLSERSNGELAGRPIALGRLGGVSVVLAESGVGKVASAAMAALLAHEFRCRAIIVAGVAGGVDPRVGIGDVVIADRLIQHDYGSQGSRGLRHYRPGVPPLGERRQDIEFRLAEPILERVKRALAGADLPLLPAGLRGEGSAPVRPQLLFGPIVSGDQFINHDAARENLRTQHGALAVEMEGAAVAQVAESFAMPCLVVRSVSDLAGAGSHLDFPRFLRAAAPIAADIVSRIVQVL